MYQVKFTSAFEKDFKRLDRHIAEKILERIRWLSENIENIKVRDVAFLPTDLKGLKKYRLSDWRILFWLDKKNATLVLYGVEHRRSVYKRF